MSDDPEVAFNEHNQPEPAVPFDYEKVFADLDGQPDPAPQGGAGKLETWLMSPEAVEYFGPRFVHQWWGLLWATGSLRPTTTLAEVARQLKVSRQAMSRHALRAFRCFGIKRNAKLTRSP